MNDKVKITLISGKGGDGAISFRREKSVDRGGPFGGNGGKGGSIYFVASTSVDTLKDYRFGRVIKGNDGQNGKTKLQYGKDGKDIFLLVPCGTVVLDSKNNILADLVNENDSYLALKGGRGGRGNAAFKSSKRKTPNFAENGMPAVKKDFYLELKLLAEVGLVGLPNAGKSTFLDATTNASPKIADYPFTTIEPMTGVCFTSDGFFVLGDIPGLIEGASVGKGLGFRFLRHIERCLVLVHIIDITSKNLIKDFELINNEIYSYKPELISLPMIICLNKIDEKYDKKKVEKFKEKFSSYPIYEISTLNKTNLKPVINKLYSLVKKERTKLQKNTTNVEVTYSPKKENISKIPEFEIIKIDDYNYEIKGERVIRTKKLINLKTEEGIDRLIMYLDKIGLNDRLKDMKVKNGSTIKIDDFEFEYFE